MERNTELTKCTTIGLSILKIKTQKQALDESSIREQFIKGSDDKCLSICRTPSDNSSPCIERSSRILRSQRSNCTARHDPRTIWFPFRSRQALQSEISLGLYELPTSYPSRMHRMTTVQRCHCPLDIPKRRDHYANSAPSDSPRRI